MKNIIIFGGAGFIGTNLTKYLLDKGNKVICIDNLYTSNKSNTELFLGNENYYFLDEDITKNIYGILSEIIDELLDGIVHEIYNLACPASPIKYQKNPIYTIHCSWAVEKICQLAIKYNAKLLHASTSEIYGDPLVHPQTENYRGNVNTIGPRSCYDEGKRIAETICYEYNKIGHRIKLVRIFNTYGPYMNKDDGRVISNFICQALRNEDITIYGDGNQTRSFQYINDLIYGITEFMNIDGFGPINIGNPNEFTINELANLILELIPESKSKIVYKELPTDDPIQRKPDITQAQELINFNPKINLREGLIKTINYFRNEITRC